MLGRAYVDLLHLSSQLLQLFGLGVEGFWLDDLDDGLRHSGMLYLPLLWEAIVEAVGIRIHWLRFLVGSGVPGVGGSRHISFTKELVIRLDGA